MKKTSWIIGTVAFVVFICLILNLGNVSIEPMTVSKRQLRARGYVSMYVGTTAVFAFCDKECADELDSILYEMGYYDH